VRALYKVQLGKGLQDAEFLDAGFAFLNDRTIPADQIPANCVLSDWHLGTLSPIRIAYSPLTKDFATGTVRLFVGSIWIMLRIRPHYMHRTVVRIRSNLRPLFFRLSLEFAKNLKAEMSLKSLVVNRRIRSRRNK
jgi:hypothetical protein